MIYKGIDKIVSISVGNTRKIFKGSELSTIIPPKNVISGTTVSNTPFKIKYNYKTYTITPVNYKFTFKTNDVITYMHSMFSECMSIASLDLSGWDISSVTNMYCVFRKCYSLTTLNLSTWDVRLSSIYTLFEDCNSLNHIICKFNFYELCIENIYNYSDLPKKMQESGTWEIVDIDNYELTPLSLEIVTDDYDILLPKIISAKATNVKTELNYKYNKLNKSSNKLEEKTRNFIHLSNNFEENTDTENSKTITVSFTYEGLTTTSSIIQNRLLSNIIKGTTINDDPFTIILNDDYIEITPVNNKFEYHAEGTLNRLDNAFENCQTITSLDLSELDTYFANLENIFTDCTELVSLNLSGWNLYSFGWDLFGDNLSKLEYLDMSNVYFHYSDPNLLSKLTNIKYINISGCNNVVSIFNTLNFSFYNCQNLTTIEGLETLNVSDLYYLENLFSGCSSLTSINLSSWNITIYGMWEMFNGCSSLTSLDISGIDIMEDIEEEIYDLFGEYSYYDENTGTDITLPGCENLTHIKCKQAFKDYCLANADLVQLPETMQEGGTGVWEIVD